MIAESIAKQTEEQVIEPGKVRITIEGQDTGTQIFEVERSSIHIELRAHSDPKHFGTIFTLTGRVVR